MSYVYLIGLLFFDQLKLHLDIHYFLNDDIEAVSEYDYDNPAPSPIVCFRRKDSFCMIPRFVVRRLDLTAATVKFLQRGRVLVFPLYNVALVRPHISSVDSIAGTTTSTCAIL